MAIVFEHLAASAGEGWCSKVLIPKQGARLRRTISGAMRGRVFVADVRSCGLGFLSTHPALIQRRPTCEIGGAAVA